VGTETRSEVRRNVSNTSQILVLNSRVQS
jgi:hypothetical protein